jgi:hypothetical protein
MRSITISAFTAVALVSFAAVKALIMAEGMIKALLVDQLPLSQSALAFTTPCTRRIFWWSRRVGPHAPGRRRTRACGPAEGQQQQ